MVISLSCLLVLNCYETSTGFESEEVSIDNSSDYSDNYNGGIEGTTANPGEEDSEDIDEKDKAYIANPINSSSINLTDIKPTVSAVITPVLSSSIRSKWAERRILIGGVLSNIEWNGAGKMKIPGGYLLVKNDNDYMYVALDLTDDYGNDTGTEDYFWISIDVDKNKKITSRRDINYGLYRGQPNRLARQYYLGPGVWTTILKETSDSKCHIGFGTSNTTTNSQRDPHRIWEMRLSLDELGIDMNAADVPPVVKIGLRVRSLSPFFTHDYPKNFYKNFNYLRTIILARHIDPNYPSGTAGAVIGGVGLIPATQIIDGYASTDSSYYEEFQEAAFGGRLNFIGNRVTMNDLWDMGARKYKVLHRFGVSGAFSPMRQTWSNYRWNGFGYILVHYGPDVDNKYPLINPDNDYSIDDLLLQWQSSGNPSGIHQFRVKFYDNFGNNVAVPYQVLSLMVDNHLPTVDIVKITHNGSPVGTCGMETMEGNDDGVRIKFNVNDAEGHIRFYRLSAQFGHGDYDSIDYDDYGNHMSPTHKWYGVTNEIVPTGEWVPPYTCAYQFRLTAYPRTTNGYGWINSHHTDTLHVTLIK